MLVDRIKGTHKCKLDYENVRYPSLVQDLYERLDGLEYVGNISWRTQELMKILMPYLETPYELFFEEDEIIKNNE